MGYTKLFSSIVTSTIWQEDNETRIVWVTLLALTNAGGQVEGSIPGLAHIANVPLDACEKALKRLMQPDPYSRTKEKEGRRIEEIDGGWQIINHAKYRDKTNVFDKEYHAIKQREYRNRQKEEKLIKEEKTTNTSTDTEVKKSESDFNAFWAAYPRKEAKGKVREWFEKNKPDADTLSKMLARIATLKQTEQWRKDNGQFIPLPTTWLNQGRWDDEGVSLNMVRPSSRAPCVVCGKPSTMNVGRDSYCGNCYV